jgi:peptidyl-prolyl cis-trans isomerase D
VIFFSPNQGGGGGIAQGALGSIRGDPIDRDEYIAAVKEAMLAHLLRNGMWPEQSAADWDERRQALNRLFLLDEARRLGIRVPDEVAAKRIVELAFLKDQQTGAFNRAAYDQFLAMLMRDRGLSRADFEEFMRNEVALQHLVQIGGLSGTLVTPREGEARYKQANELYSAEVVTFPASNYLSQVNLDPENVARHYTNRQAEYRIPERVQVRYVKFPATNFLDEARQTLESITNLAARVDAAYQQQSPEDFKDAEGNVLSPEAAKEQLKDEAAQAQALTVARRKAVEFANKLFNMPPSAESLSQLAAENGYEARTSEPFDEMRPPIDMNVPSTFNRAAFALSPEQPFAIPVTGEDGVYVFAFERRIPSEIQPLEAVRGRVIDSLMRTESRELAERAGRDFIAAVTNAMAGGQTFAEAAAAAGYQPVSVTNFTRTTFLSQLPRLSGSELSRTASELKPGEVSGFVPMLDGGYVLCLTARGSVSDEELKQELPGYLDQLRQFGRFSAFAEWQQRQFAAANVRMPGLEPETNAPPQLP